MEYFSMLDSTDLIAIEKAPIRYHVDLITCNYRSGGYAGNNGKPLEHRAVVRIQHDNSLVMSLCDAYDEKIVYLIRSKEIYLLSKAGLPDRVSGPQVKPVQLPG